MRLASNTDSSRSANDVTVFPLCNCCPVLAIMPVCTLYVLKLNSSTSEFLSALRQTSLRPITVARVIRWIVCPTTLSLDALLPEDQGWDLLLVFRGASSALTNGLNDLIERSWSIQAGVPSGLLATYNVINAKLLHPSPGHIPMLTKNPSTLRLANSTQDLELTKELNDWIIDGDSPSGAVSMLNLLSFNPGKKEEYMRYGQAFSEYAGSRRGGVAKLVGKVIPKTCSDGCNEWNEVGSMNKETY